MDFRYYEHEYHDLLCKHEKLEKDNALLLQALEQYASVDNWQRDPYGGYHLFDTTDDTTALIPEPWEPAQKALGLNKKESEE